MLIEKSFKYQRDLYICYIDYVQAFHCVMRSKLIESVERLEIDGRVLRLIRNLYYYQNAAIQIQG